MPLFWLSLAFTAGLFSSSLLNLPIQLYISLLFLFSLCTLAEFKFSDVQSHPLLSKPLVKLPFSLIAAVFVLGGCRFEAAMPVFDETDLAWYTGSKDVIVTGQIISYPENATNSTAAVIRARSILLPDEDEKVVNGKLELRLPGGFHLSYGDMLTMEGTLGKVSNAETEPFSSFQARKGVYNRMAYPQIETIAQNTGNSIMAAIYRLRQKALEVIYNQTPYPESTLLSGILLGIDWVIPDFLKDAYQACGVIHIIAISGFNIALVSNFITKLTQRFLSPAKAGFTAISAIVIYTLMVGADPAVVRAAVMGSLTVPATLLGRRTIPIHSLAGGRRANAVGQSISIMGYRLPVVFPGLPGLDLHRGSTAAMDPKHLYQVRERIRLPMVAAYPGIDLDHNLRAARRIACDLPDKPADLPFIAAS